jgi:hypothetical protein
MQMPARSPALVRERRRDMGEIGPDLASVAVTDGSGAGSTLDLAAGDRVRLFAQTRGIFVDDQGRRKSAVVGDNGTVLDVLGADPKEGLQLRGESGKVAFVPWTALRDRNGTDRLLLGSGEVLTIDSSQGMTSHEHIDALPAGSAAVNGYKAYVAASRHRIRHYLIGSMGAELREVKARRMSGLPRAPRSRAGSVGNPGHEPAEAAEERQCPRSAGTDSRQQAGNHAVAATRVTASRNAGTGRLAGHHGAATTGGQGCAPSPTADRRRACRHGRAAGRDRPPGGG